MNNVKIPITGMHCASCEILIGENLKKIPEVKEVKVSHKTAQAIITYGDKKPSDNDIEKAVQNAGYRLGKEKDLPWLSTNLNDYKDLMLAITILAGVYYIANRFGIFDLSVETENKSLFVSLLVGLVAGVSSCMALISGLVLGLSARHAELHPEASAFQKFRPHIFFNLGRIGGYTLLGGLIGTIGQALKPSGNFLGFMIIATGAIMILFGLKLIEIFPILRNKSITLPAGLARLLGLNKDVKEYSHRGAATLGALTFFLPCGFTQTMQLYAVTSGSFLKGAIIMGLFALGTAPGLLSVGGLSAILKGRKARIFYMVAGLAVILLGWWNITNGQNLLNGGTGAVKETTVISNGEVQEIRMTQKNNGYSPNVLTVEKGRPVKWIIDSTAPFSCAASIIMPKYKINKILTSGQNIITFTPTEVGEIPFSCSMGMYRGKFIVVDKTSQNDTGTKYADNTVPDGTTCGSAGGGGCGGCGGGAPIITNPTPTNAQNTGDEQVIATVYNNPYEDIQPNSFTVKKGQPVRFEIEAKVSGSGCMSSVMIPGLYNTPEQLRAGQKIVMNFTPTKTGTYDITCAMGVPRGEITVIN